jgi:hypothetical protein
VLKWRVGDCFDFSILLVSYLIGAGYDAYVVSGIAPQWLCLRDQANTVCPLLIKEQQAKLAAAQSEADKPVEEESRYQFRDREIPGSKFEAAQAKKKEDEIARKKAENEQSDEEEEEEVDPLAGQRVHSWVLVRAGKREVQAHFFVEPSTGCIYPINKSPYLKIESIWNNSNYWVNMQDPENGVENIQYDVSNAEDWEYAFIEPETQKAGDQEDSEDGQMDDINALSTPDNPETSAGGEDENILDIPSSWVPKLAISRDLHAKKFCKSGQTMVLYQKAKLEEYADGSHEQGLVMRLTIFKDRARTVPIEIRENFKCRKDKLEFRIRYPLEGKVWEHFLPGRHVTSAPEALKDRIEWIGRRRELHFYTSARIDGLVRREDDIGTKSIEIFQGRDDKRVYRSVSMSQDRDAGIGKPPSYELPGGHLGSLVIHKMTEKFERDTNKPAQEDVRKRTYYVRDDKIRCIYHYSEGRITSAQRIYHKGGGNPPKRTEVIEIDPHAIQPSDEQLEEELVKVVNAERECFHAVRRADGEKDELLKMRKREEGNILLERSIFDTARENAKQDAKQELRNEDAEELDARSVDYLTPFLQNVSDQLRISKDEAAKARESCLRALKDRLLERANIIQTRLDEENSALAKRQAAFQRSQRDHDQGGDEEFERFCSETMFRIQILEQRLTRHEETALQKYADLDHKLHNDPRLAILNQ